MKLKKGKLAQYGKRIFNLTGTEDEIANEAINKTVAFFHTMEWTLNYLIIPKILIKQLIYCKSFRRKRLG
jgi:hypothetical protein